MPHQMEPSALVERLERSGAGDFLPAVSETDRSPEPGLKAAALTEIRRAGVRIASLAAGLDSWPGPP